MMINVLDLLFLTVIGFTLIRGLFRGLIKEFASLFGLICAFIAANRYYEELSEYLGKIITNQIYNSILSYILLFLIVLICVLYAGVGLRKILHSAMLGWLDRLCGGVLGLLKGGLICVVIMFGLTFFLSPQSKLLANSKTAPGLNLASKYFIQLIPKNMKGAFKQKSRQWQEKWEGSLWYKLSNPEKSKPRQKHQ